MVVWRFVVKKCNHKVNCWRRRRRRRSLLLKLLLLTYTYNQFIVLFFIGNHDKACKSMVTDGTKVNSTINSKKL